MSRALVVAIVPAIATGLFFRYLVPSPGAERNAFANTIALLARQYPAYLAVALFLSLSAIARYWLFVLGGSPAPAPARSVGSAGRLGSWRRHAVTPVLIGSAVAVALLLRACVAQPYRVLSTSMLPTLDSDDVVLGRPRVSALGNESLPKRGDVVVFRSDSVGVGPTDGRLLPDVLVKRVIGLPGDRVAMRGSVPVINDWPVPSCDAGEYLYLSPAPGEPGLHGRVRVEYLDDRVYLSVYTRSAPFDATYTVKPGEVFVLGDNRGNSVDSRAYGAGHGGGVPVTGIAARIDRFLVGTHRTGDMDFGRFMASIDTLQTRFRFEGADTTPLENGIANCLAKRPAQTHPPSP